MLSQLSGGGGGAKEAPVCAAPVTSQPGAGGLEGRPRCAQGAAEVRPGSVFVCVCSGSIGALWAPARQDGGAGREQVCLAWALIKIPLPGHVCSIACKNSHRAHLSLSELGAPLRQLGAHLIDDSAAGPASKAAAATRLA